MLNWARGLLGSAIGVGEGAIKSLISAAVSGISAVLDTVFGHVFGAWRDLARATEIASVAWGHYQEWTFDHLRHIIGHDIPVFAQGAYWWIAHPDALARRLFWWLVRMAEDNAFTAAQHLGSFLLSLAWHHTEQIAQTAEDIIDAVL